MHTWVFFIVCVIVCFGSANLGLLKDHNTREAFVAFAKSLFSMQELQRYAHDLLHGLSVLHKVNICHRDIRPPNVIYYLDYDGSYRYILIDLESAAPSGAQLPPVHFAAWDEYTLVNSKYMPESDLYQLAKMPKELSKQGGVNLSEDGRDFIRKLGSKQSSAGALLTYGWLECVCDKGVEFSLQTPRRTMVRSDWPSSLKRTDTTTACAFKVCIE
jgi:serine/threonine protein kinase